MMITGGAAHATKGLKNATAGMRACQDVKETIYESKIRGYFVVERQQTAA
jgi:hypothetical protein